MKIALVSPATVVDFGRERAFEPSVRQLAEHVPLGVLTLVAILRARGCDVDLIDSNAVYYEQRHRSIVDALTQRLAAGRYDLVGFGTLSSSYPLVLRVATALKRVRGSTAIVLGGPQASVVDRATLAAFEAVDFVLRGEADDTLGELVRTLEAGEPLAGVPALSYRDRDAVVQNAPGALPLELDRLPLPAYDCAPALAASDTLPLEVGRGCPYGCTFCSTNTFFSRRFRMKSPARVLEQLRELHRRYGVTRFDFVHDMLTVVRSDVVELCQALIDAGSPYRWYASARTDRVDEELLDLLRAAGCSGLFFGIETGSPKLQRSLKKRLDLKVAMQRVEQAAARRLDVVVSLITGFPEEDVDDVRYTVDLFVQSLRLASVSPQLHLLAPLAGTPIHAAYRDRLVFDDVMSDMSHSGWAPERADIELIARHPDVFPNFYGVPTPTDRQLLKELRLFLLEAASAFRWLLLALHRAGHAYDVLLQFRAWRATRVAPQELQQYYSSRQFRDDFLRFVRTQPAHGGAVRALLTIAECAHDSSVEAPAGATRGDRPRQSPGVALAQISLDFDGLMAALASGSDLSHVPPREVTVVVRTSAAGPEMFELPSLAARVLKLCDGERTPASIASALADDARALGVSVDLLYSTAVTALQSAKLVIAAQSPAELRPSPE